MTDSYPRLVFDVYPDDTWRKRALRWKVCIYLSGGGSFAPTIIPDLGFWMPKVDAVDFAKQTAHDLWTRFGIRTEVRVRRSNGTFTKEAATYGRDPRRTAG